MLLPRLVPRWFARLASQLARLVPRRQSRLKPRRPVLAAASALGLLATSACGVLNEAAGEETAETIVIALPDWTGGQATAGMARSLLEAKWDHVSVELVNLGQAEAWDALATGQVHALMEDWGALPDQRELYVEEKRNVTDAGELGITGRVGWYVPQAYADAHPGVLRAENLGEFAGDFGGEVLEGDPYHATHDEEIIAGLGLPLRPAPTGSEDALIEEIRAADEAGEPLLAYFWRPHWLHTETDLAEVELPAEYYPDRPLHKYLNRYFLQTRGEPAEFLRDFTWTEQEQNEVARLIARGLTPRAAAEEWARDHPERVAEWLGATG
jgi:glycine betaine/proline transport system substrate-binding protein